MLRRALPLCRHTTHLPFAPCYRSGLSQKPIDEVLKDCRPWDEQQWQADLDVLAAARISTAGDWLHLSPDDKLVVKNAGLPATVINSLNRAVRVGLLMPSFSFRQACKFIVTRGYDECTNSSVADEASSVLQIADNVDRDWDLVHRQHCDFLCYAYHRLVELTLKMALQGWRDEPDAQFIHYERYWTDHGKKPAKHFKRYRHTDDLLELANEVQRHASTFAGVPVPDERSLARITTCAGGTARPVNRISCQNFFSHAEVISPYVQQLWQTMDAHPPKHRGYDPSIEWLQDPPL